MCVLVLVQVDSVFPAKMFMYYVLALTRILFWHSLTVRKEDNVKPFACDTSLIEAGEGIIVVR